MQVFVIALGCLLILTQFEIDVTQHHIERDKALTRLEEFLMVTPVEFADRVDYVIGKAEGRHRNLLFCKAALQRLQHRGLAIQNGRIVGHCSIAIYLPNRSDRLRDIGSVTILASQLQIGPGTESSHGGILVGHHILRTSLQCGIAMGQIIVTVVDDLIVEIHAVILVAGISREP